MNNQCTKCGALADSSKNYYCRPCYNTYMRDHRSKNIERIRECHRRCRMKMYRNSALQRFKDRANRSVCKAIDNGNLQVKVCEICGDSAQAHHDSYLQEDWLNIRWLCRNHHSEWHRKNTPITPTLEQAYAYEDDKKPKTEWRDRTILELYDAGQSYAQIGRGFGITRQRVCQVVQKRYIK